MTYTTLLSSVLPYFHLNFKEPFRWISGYEMPIYFDGKSFLSLSENRLAVLEKYQMFLPEKFQTFQTLAATPNGGLIPTASLAAKMNKPLAFFYQENLYRFTPSAVEKTISDYAHYSQRNCDMVVSTAPFGILPGVRLADALGVPFLYVRKEVKAHGTKNVLLSSLLSLSQSQSQFESKKAIFIDWHDGNGYGEKALLALEEQGVTVIEYKDAKIPSQGKGRVKLGKTIHLEDVVSFGGSSLQDISQEREHGAVVEQCMPVFTYNFPETLERFSREHCELKALLTFEEVLAVSSWTSEEKEKLKRWHDNPRQWKERGMIYLL